jgi:hypothetical protein
MTRLLDRGSSPTMQRLLREAWKLHRHAQDERLSHLVRPSVPILFFGDSRRYETSPLKVLTVGLNPSKLEFPAPDPFRRYSPRPGDDRGRDRRVRGERGRRERVRAMPVRAVEAGGHRLMTR